jgi:hypothetical protein
MSEHGRMRIGCLLFIPIVVLVIQLLWGGFLYIVQQALYGDNSPLLIAVITIALAFMLVGMLVMWEDD